MVLFQQNPEDQFVCPKKGISPTILFWGWDLDHQSYSRDGILHKPTPWKINMEPKNHPIEGRNIIWTKPSWLQVQNVNLQGWRDCVPEKNRFGVSDFLKPNPVLALFAHKGPWPRYCHFWHSLSWVGAVTGITGRESAVSPQGVVFFFEASTETPKTMPLNGW